MLAELMANTRPQISSSVYANRVRSSTPRCGDSAQREEEMNFPLRDARCENDRLSLAYLQNLRGRPFDLPAMRGPARRLGR